MKKFLFFFFFSIIFMLDMKAQGSDESFNIQLVNDSPDSNSFDKVIVSFAISNNKSKELSFCKYMTPFEGFKGDFFTVLDKKGKQMEYKGINVKRSEPRNVDYLIIASDSKEEVSFNLLDVYEITKKGKYKVQFKGSPYLNMLPDSNILEFELK